MLTFPKPIPKGPAPVNRLSSNNLTQASPHTQPSKIGNNASSSNPPFKQPLQKFNFHEEHSRRGEQPPRKRQRVDGTPTSHNGSSKSPIDLEAGSANSNRQMGPPASKSGSSQGMKGPQYQGVEEYHRVEDTVGFSKRKNNPPDRQISNGNGSKRFLPKAKNERWVGRLDDDNDPISEDDLAVTGSRHINKATSQLARKSNLEVQIPTPRQAEGTTGYQGTSHKQPSRPKEKMWGNGDARQTPEEEKGEKFSRFFPNAQNPQQRKNSTGSHSADDTAPSRTSARLSDQQNGTPSTKKAPTDNSSPPLNPNVSIDELNADEFYQHTAGTLLAKQKTARAGESKSKGADKRSQSITLDESSDDDLSNDKANMITTDFIPSSKAKPKKRPGEVTFDVLQVFSKSYKWLLASSLKRWTLLENCKEGTFTIFDEHGEAVPDLVLAPQSISKIVRGKDNSKLVLHKSMDQTAKRSPQICLELSDEAECDFFAERLKKAYPNIGNTSEPG